MQLVGTEQQHVRFGCRDMQMLERVDFGVRPLTFHD